MTSHSAGGLAGSGQDGHALSLFFSARVQLCACALASALVSYGFITRPYPLVPLFADPLLDLGKLAAYQPAAALAFALAYVLLFVLYLAAYRAAQRLSQAADFLLVLGGGLVLCTALLWAYPVGALDIYDNVFRAREWALYGYNPLVVVPAQLSGDAWYPYVVWTWAPSAYGPMWAALSFGLYRLAGDDLLRNLLAHKLLAVAALAGSTCLIYDLLRAGGRRDAAAGALLFAWNPLVLFEGVVNAHNDVLMMAMILLALWLQVRRRRVPALLACVLAGLVKVAALAALPVLFVATWRSVPARRQFAAKAGAACLALAALAYAPLWAGVATFQGIALQNERFTTSVAAIVKLALETQAGTANAEAWTRGLFALLLAAAYLVLLRRTPAGPPALWRHLFGVFALLLVVGTLWFQPWYVVWPLALAPLAGANERRLAVMWSAGALSLYLLFDFVWVWYADFLNTANELVVNIAAASVWLVPIALTQAWSWWRARQAHWMARLAP